MGVVIGYSGHMRPARWFVILAALASTACSSSTAASTPSPSPAGSPAASTGPSPSPTPEATATLPAGPPRCHTADLEVVIASEGGAAGHIGLDFEVRNRSAQECRVFGYFGLSLLNSDGKVAIAAQRSTHIFTASTGPPAAVLLPPASAPLPARSATGGPPAAVAGHAHFAAAYGDVCDNAPNGTGNAWQLYPPDETQPTSILTPSGQNITICGLQLTPVQVSPPTP